MFELCDCKFDNKASIIRRFANTFSNGFRKQQTDASKQAKQEQSKRRMIKRKRRQEVFMYNVSFLSLLTRGEIIRGKIQSTQINRISVKLNAR